MSRLSAFQAWMPAGKPEKVEFSIVTLSEVLTRMPVPAPVKLTLLIVMPDMLFRSRGC